MLLECHGACGACVVLLWFMYMVAVRRAWDLSSVARACKHVVVSLSCVARILACGGAWTRHLWWHLLHVLHSENGLQRVRGVRLCVVECTARIFTHGDAWT